MHSKILIANKSTAPTNAANIHLLLIIWTNLEILLALGRKKSFFVSSLIVKSDACKYPD